MYITSVRMTFKCALHVKTIKERASIIGTFIDQTPIGKISQENMDIFLILFEKYYTPDEGEYKYTRDDIASIAIYWNEVSRFKPSKCFNIILHDHSQKTDKERHPIPVSRKRLSGENRTGYANFNEGVTGSSRFANYGI
jgi:hypothetical protein